LPHFSVKELSMLLSEAVKQEVLPYLFGTYQYYCTLPEGWLLRNRVDVDFQEEMITHVCCT